MHEIGAIVYLMDYLLRFDTSKLVHGRTWFAGVVCQNIAFTYFAYQFKWIVVYQSREEPNAYCQARVAQSLTVMIGWVNADLQFLKIKMTKTMKKKL